MPDRNTATGGRQATAPLSARFVTFCGPAALLAAALAAPGPVIAAGTGDEIVIVRRYEKLGDAKVDFAPTRPGQIICYAYDAKGITIGHEFGAAETGSIRFYDIPLADVADVNCERQD